MKLVFISDLHLSPTTEENNQLFYQLLEQWQHELDALYILGDFFDYWVGDDDDNAFTQTMKLAFKKFTEHKPIYFIGGNHDFGVGKHFAKETGIKLIKDCTTLRIGKNNILLSHGDVFCTLDVNYQRMKKILQNKAVMFLLRRIPLTWRYKLKEKLEHKASGSFNTKPKEIYQVVDTSIAKIANQHHTNIIIHGHTHNPGHYTINSKHGIITRFEIPDWVDRLAGGYVLLDNDNIEIRNSC